MLVDLLVMTINKSESSDETADSKIIWDHLSSQLVFFVLSQFARFAGLVGLLYDKVILLKLFKCDYLNAN